MLPTAVAPVPISLLLFCVVSFVLVALSAFWRVMEAICSRAEERGLFGGAFGERLGRAGNLACGGVHLGGAFAQFRDDVVEAADDAADGDDGDDDADEDADGADDAHHEGDACARGGGLIDLRLHVRARACEPVVEVVLERRARGADAGGVRLAREAVGVAVDEFPDAVEGGGGGFLEAVEDFPCPLAAHRGGDVRAEAGHGCAEVFDVFVHGLFVCFAFPGGERVHELDEVQAEEGDCRALDAGDGAEVGDFVVAVSGEHVGEGLEIRVERRPEVLNAVVDVDGLDVGVFHAEDDGFVCDGEDVSPLFPEGVGAGLHGGVRVGGEVRGVGVDDALHLFFAGAHAVAYRGHFRGVGGGDDVDHADLPVEKDAVGKGEGDCPVAPPREGCAVQQECVDAVQGHAHQDKRDDDENPDCEVDFLRHGHAHDVFLLKVRV